MSFFFDVWTSQGFAQASDVRLTEADRDAVHAVELNPGPRADRFLERGDVSAVSLIANRQWYAPRIMRDTLLRNLIINGWTQ